MAASTCPLCLSEIGKATAFKCPGCGSKYHKDCAADSGECIVVGCSAAAKSKTRSVTQPRATTPTRSSLSGSQSQKPASRIVLIVAIAASLLIRIGAGYNVGDTAGYNRGYSVGFSNGDDAGYSRGRVDGCEWVFDQLNYQNLIGYNPNAYLNFLRYGSIYIAKSQCS